MLPEKKPGTHAEIEDDGESEPINFAWVILIGMKIGYSEAEIAKMYFGKWCDMFEEYQKFYNFEIKRGLFEEKKEVSLMDL